MGGRSASGGTNSNLCPLQLILAHDLTQGVGFVLETATCIGSRHLRELAYDLLRGLTGIRKRLEMFSRGGFKAAALAASLNGFLETAVVNHDAPVIRSSADCRGFSLSEGS